jgi:hypothetical protein
MDSWQKNSKQHNHFPSIDANVPETPDETADTSMTGIAVPGPELIARLAPLRPFAGVC